MGYAEDSLIPVMQHIAKNVVKVNEGLSKHLVSGVWIMSAVISASSLSDCSEMKDLVCSSARRLRTSTPVRSK